MNGRFTSTYWAIVLLAVLGAVAIGGLAYQAGVTHGLALQLPAGQPSTVLVPLGWYRPWGFGFFGPLLFVLFWVLLFRGLIWRGWRRRWNYAGPDDFARRFEEWHRRAHDRMKEEPGNR